jgi:hypothetical protein
MIQEIIVAIIGIVVFGILAYKLYAFFFIKNEASGACGCSSCHCNISKKMK